MDRHLPKRSYARLFVKIKRICDFKVSQHKRSDEGVMGYSQRISHDPQLGFVVSVSHDSPRICVVFRLSVSHQRVGCRDHDVLDQLERGERDENANGDFTGFYGIEFFEEIVHDSSPWVKRVFG